MSACTADCRATTGSRFEHCKVIGCHQTFGGNTLGDAHRVMVGSYVLALPTARSKSWEVKRFDTEADVPEGWVISSVGNTEHRCLTIEEMEAKGWRLVKGVWRGPESDVKWWTKPGDEDAEYHEAALGTVAEEPDEEDSELPPAEPDLHPGLPTVDDIMAGFEITEPAAPVVNDSGEWAELLDGLLPDSGNENNSSPGTRSYASIVDPVKEQWSPEAHELSAQLGAELEAEVAALPRIDNIVEDLPPTVDTVVVMRTQPADFLADFI